MTEAAHGAPAAGNGADRLIDELLPEDLDWRYLVRTYPVPSLVLAAVGGFLVGRRHGQAVLGALSGYLAAEVTEVVRANLGGEVP